MANMTTTANHKVDSAWKSAAQQVQVAVKKVRDDALKKIKSAQATSAGDRQELLDGAQQLRAEFIKFERRYSALEEELTSIQPDEVLSGHN